MSPPKKKYSTLSKSAKYYRDNSKARKKKTATSTKINKREDQKAKRRELGKKNYAHDKKNGKASRAGKDASHQKNGNIRYQDSSKNRGNGSNTKGDRKARKKKP